MPTEPITGSGNGSFGQECSSTLNRCATLALDAAYPILQRTGLRTLFTASQ